MAAPDPLLRTDGLTKDYNGLRALDGLTFRVSPGEVVGLLGPNGSGKSTALRLLLGFLRPTAGRAAIAGHDCWRDGVAARRHVGEGAEVLADGRAGRGEEEGVGHEGSLRVGVGGGPPAAL